MRSDNHKIVDIDGAQLQHGWPHCVAAPMDQRSLPPDRATPEEWEVRHDTVDDFQRNWAFDRRESGLGASSTSKWICLARAGRAGAEYFGGRRWRRLFKRRALVERVFGILKSASRQRLRRGQSRLRGLAMASIIAAVKVSVYYEEQLGAWRDRTGNGPADHPLLQPDAPYWGSRDLTEDEAKANRCAHLRRLRGGTVEPIRKAA